MCVCVYTIYVCCVMHYKGTYNLIIFINNEYFKLTNIMLTHLFHNNNTYIYFREV